MVTNRTWITAKYTNLVFRGRHFIPTEYHVPTLSDVHFSGLEDLEVKVGAFCFHLFIIGQD